MLKMIGKLEKGLYFFNGILSYFLAKFMIKL